MRFTPYALCTVHTVHVLVLSTKFIEDFQLRQKMISNAKEVLIKTNLGWERHRDWIPHACDSLRGYGQPKLYVQTDLFVETGQGADAAE